MESSENNSSHQKVQETLDLKKTYDLKGLQKLQKFIDSQNFARISLKQKQKGPDGWHIQCYHFKSKKCPYRIRFLRDIDNNGRYLDTYQLEDYVLKHENHQIYKSIDKQIRISKNKIEQHRKLIIKIYLDLKKKDEKNAKPLKIQEILLKNHKVDIYDGHKSKSSQEKLKKKLDNIIRDYKLSLQYEQKQISQPITQEDITISQPNNREDQQCYYDQSDDQEMSIFACLDLNTNNDQFSTLNNPNIDSANVDDQTFNLDCNQ